MTPGDPIDDPIEPVYLPAPLWDEVERAFGRSAAERYGRMDQLPTTPVSREQLGEQAMAADQRRAAHRAQLRQISVRQRRR